MLTTLKVRLSTLKHRSWHYRLVEFAYGNHIRGTKKACPYWWLVVPSSFPLAAGKLLGMLVVGVIVVVVIVVGSVGYWVLVALGWFFGYRPYRWTFWSFMDYAMPSEAESYPHKKHPMFKPYKHKKYPIPRTHGPKYGHIRIAPYQVVFPVVAVGALVVGLIAIGRSGTNWAGHHYMLFVWIFVSIAVLYVLSVVYRKLVVPGLKKAYAKYCPEITWVDDTAENEAELDE